MHSQLMKPFQMIPSVSAGAFVFYEHIFLYPPQTKFGGVYKYHPVRLSIRLSVQNKLNLGHNFLTKGDRALI